jgi:hypothetical protein
MFHIIEKRIQKLYILRRHAFNAFDAPVYCTMGKVIEVLFESHVKLRLWSTITNQNHVYLTSFGTFTIPNLIEIC